MNDKNPLVQEPSSLSFIYSTKDTCEAAYLYSLGFVLEKVDSASFPSVFHFQNNNGTSDLSLSNHIYLYQTGEAVCNVTTFFRSYKMLLARIKERD